MCGCKRPVEIFEISVWRYPKFLCGCKRPVEIFKISVWVQDTLGDVQNFCMGIRDPRRCPKVLFPKKTHGHSYHLNLELGDRSQD